MRKNEKKSSQSILPPLLFHFQSTLNWDLFLTIYNYPLYIYFIKIIKQASK